MSDILTQIGAYKRREIAEAKVRVPRGTLEREIRDQSPPRGFLKALERAREEGRFGLIAEIKKVEPVERAYPRAFRAEVAGQGLSERRRLLPLRADRRAVVPRLAGPSQDGAGRDLAADPAQGFPVRFLSGAGGARLGRRLHPHHHGRGRRRDRAHAQQDRARPRPRRADRGAQRERARPGAGARRAANRHQQPRPQDLRDLACGLRAAAPSMCRSTGSSLAKAAFSATPIAGASRKRASNVSWSARR